jgi:hypothetical protein
MPEIDIAALEILFAKQQSMIPLVMNAVDQITDRYSDNLMTIQKTQLKIGSGGGFCWIWPPFRRVKGTPKLFVYLSFGLRRPLNHPRVTAAANPSRNRWTIHTVLENEENLNEELFNWLDESAATIHLKM